MASESYPTASPLGQIISPYRTVMVGRQTRVRFLPRPEAQRAPTEANRGRVRHFMVEWLASALRPAPAEFTPSLSCD